MQPLGTESEKGRETLKITNYIDGIGVRGIELNPLGVQRFSDCVVRSKRIAAHLRA